MLCKSVNARSRIVALLAVLTIVVSLTPLPCLAVLHGDVELLKTVALKHKANFDSLMTWKGEAFDEVIGTDGDRNSDCMRRSKCSFAYDKSQNAARWNKQPLEHRFVVDGKPQRDVEAIYNSAMVKGKSSYQYRAWDQRDGEDYFVLTIGPLGWDRSLDLFTFDPVCFFSDPGIGQPMYDRLMWLYDNADNIVKPGSQVMYLKRAENLVTMETWIPEHKCAGKYVFDLSVGGNVIECSNKSPNAETVHEFQYEQQSGVWVPKSYKYANITGKQKGAGALKSTRSIRWSSSVVNVPFEEDEFTLKKLGIKDGDTIQGRGGDVEYNESLTDAEVLKAIGYQEPISPLVGKRLPSLEQVGVELDPAELEGKRILVCFWDMNQRPSRYMVSQLGKRAEELKGKQVVVVLVQASKVDEKALNEWVEIRKISFPVSMVKGDEEHFRFNWGVKALPWLILTDEHHTVQAEGFRLEELNEQIRALEAKEAAVASKEH